MLRPMAPISCAWVWPSAWKSQGVARQASAAMSACRRSASAEGEVPAHAIADHDDRPAGLAPDGVQRALQPAGDIAGQVEALLLRPRRIPIDHERRVAAPGEIGEEAALRLQVQDVIAVDQGRHDQHPRRRRIAAAPIVAQQGRALAPQHRPIRCPARAGMAPIAQHAVDEVPQPTMPFEGQGVDQRRFIRLLEFRRETLQRACERAWLPLPLRALPGGLQARPGGGGVPPQRQRQHQVLRQRARAQAPLRRGRRTGILGRTRGIGLLRTRLGQSRVLRLATSPAKGMARKRPSASAPGPSGSGPGPAPTRDPARDPGACAPESAALPASHPASRPNGRLVADQQP